MLALAVVLALFVSAALAIALLSALLLLLVAAETATDLRLLLGGEEFGELEAASAATVPAQFNPRGH